MKKKTRQNKNREKSKFFEISLARLIMENIHNKQKRKDKISVRNERDDVTVFSINIKRIVIKYYKQLCQQI